MKHVNIIFLLLTHDIVAGIETTAQTDTTEALDPEIESALRDIDNIDIIDKALEDFLGPFDEFLNNSGRLNDVGANGTLPDGWQIDLQPLRQLPQWPNCTELARYMVFLYQMSENFDPNNLTAESAEAAKNLMGKLTAEVYVKAYETCPKTSYVNGTPPALPWPPVQGPLRTQPKKSAPADTVASILRHACKEFKRDFIKKMLCDKMLFVIENIDAKTAYRRQLKKKLQQEYDERCRCPPTSYKGPCNIDGVKRCHFWGKQPAGWTHNKQTCGNKKDCLCYHDPHPCPPNANFEICFKAGVKGCYGLGKQPTGWTLSTLHPLTRETRCLDNKNCFCYHAPVLFATTVAAPVTPPVQSCNCQPCKDILNGPYAGTWTLISSNVYNCDNDCLYVKGGEYMCFCDPGDHSYLDC